MVLFQADLLEWLCALGLPQYHKHLVSSGYDSMGLVAELTWEELQEIGVNKLGEDSFLAGLPPASKGLQNVFRVQSQKREWGLGGTGETLPSPS